MPPSSHSSLSPSVIGSVVRYRRLVLVVVAVCALIALIYTAVSGSEYTGKAQIVIAQPPTFLPPFPVSGSHSTAAAYVNQQVAIMQSQPVSYGAAAIVNNKVSGANVTGDQIHSGLTIKPQTGAAAGINTTTQVLVTMPTAELAAASANAVIASYIQALHHQIRTQASQSISALDKEIAAVTAELNGLPPPTATKTTVPSTTNTTTTTLPRPPKTTTTRVPRTTTTRVPRTTTTRSTTTTTTTTIPSTSTSAAASTTGLNAGDLKLVSFRASTDTTTTTPASTSTSTSSSSSSGSAGQRVTLTATLVNLTRSRSQVRVDEQTDLAYRPAVFPATIPTTTSNGNFLRNFVIGVLIGLLIGMIAAYAIAVRRRQFEKPEEPELLYAVPLISAVPAFNQNAWLPAGLPILTEPAEEPAERIRAIATALRSIRNSSPSLIAGFSAASPRSGTTTMVANVGLALAQMDERVLVMDGDPIGRGLTRTLTDTDNEFAHLHPRAGFSEVVGGRPLIDTVVRADAVPRLSVLTSGLDPDLAMHRWSPQSIRLALRDAAEHFDIVLIDIPPVGSSSYGIDLADAAENLVLVVPYLDLIEDHDRLKERMRVSDITMLGYVFNGAPTRNHFSPYYPILHDAGQQQAIVVPPSPGAALPQTVITTPPPPPSYQSPGRATEDDITGVTTAVRTEEPSPAQPVSGGVEGDDKPTGRTPVVEPE
jgi:Mrp family chromosome partitioning ATPase